MLLHELTLSYLFIGQIFQPNRKSLLFEDTNHLFTWSTKRRPQRPCRR